MRRLQVRVLLDVPLFRGGMLIVFEGIDGSGKSSQARLLAQAVKETGRLVTLSHEPTNGPHGQKVLRSFSTGRLPIEEEMTLFLADRREHLEKKVQPALHNGHIVILDRYYFSNMAYQACDALSAEEIRQLNEEFALPPDLVFVIDVPEEVALDRIKKRDGKTNTFEITETLQKCRKVYRSLQLPGLHILDGQSSVESLHQKVWQIVSGKLGS